MSSDFLCFFLNDGVSVALRQHSPEPVDVLGFPTWKAGITLEPTLLSVMGTQGADSATCLLSTWRSSARRKSEELITAAREILPWDVRDRAATG